MYGIYWKVWFGLLCITVLMVTVDQLALPRQMLLSLLLSAMMVKACLIGAFFMHLRFERRTLVLAVVLGLPVNAAILYGLIAPDALRIFGMMQKP